MSKAPYIDAQREHKDKIFHTVLAIAGVIAIFYICARAEYIYETESGTKFISIVTAFIKLFDFRHPEQYLQLRINLEFFKMLGVIYVLVAFCVWAYFDQKFVNRHYKDGEQFGTAEFHTVESMREFNKQFNLPLGSIEADSPFNTIYSEHCQLGADDRDTGLNSNAIIIGGPGSGKSHFIVKPNLLQAGGIETDPRSKVQHKATSYVVTDPSGELLAQTGSYFESIGYKIRVFNIIDMTKSHRYNPFRYIKEEQDVLSLIQILMDGTDNGQRGGDKFWDKAERALFEALVFYARSFGPEYQNFSFISSLILKGKLDGSGDVWESELDRKFAEFERDHPDHLAVKQYRIFKLAPVKTQQSILISAGVRLDPFNIPTVKDLTSEDDLHLEELGDTETILFIEVPQGSNPYAFLVNMMYTQMFDTLYRHAAESGDTRLPHDIRFIMDEFANIGVIPFFLERLTTMRKYGMYCMIFIQAVGQIKNLYKDNWETIMGACDTLVYLGGNEPSSIDDLVKKLGDQTIRIKDKTHSKSGSKGTDSSSYKYGKRALLTADEVRRLKKGHAIIVIRGQQPFYDSVFDPIKMHKNGKYLGNRDTGDNMYVFDYCNTSVQDVEYDEMCLRKELENMVISSERTGRTDHQLISLGDPSAKAQTYTAPSNETPADMAPDEHVINVMGSGVSDTTEEAMRKNLVPVTESVAAANSGRKLKNAESGGKGGKGGADKEDTELQEHLIEDMEYGDKFAETYR